VPSISRTQRSPQARNRLRLLARLIPPRSPHRSMSASMTRPVPIAVNLHLCRNNVEREFTTGDARHARAVLKMQINKSDRNDAAGIARIMQTGWFKEVRVKDLDSHSVRALLASRALLVKIKRDLENQIRGLLKNVGLVIGRAKFN